MTRSAFSVLCCGVLAACLGPAPAKSGEISWEDAVALLNTGDVTIVNQAHDLTVVLWLEDGQKVKTVEPHIDAIFLEVEKCGAKCTGIGMVTE